jgi:hypothetical protein
MRFLSGHAGEPSPSRRTLLIFALLGLLCLAQLGWWLIFHIEQTGHVVEARREALLARRHEAAGHLAGRAGIAPGPVEGFP